MTETKDPRLIDAEIEKALAEAARARAEIRVFEVDEQIKMAEARQKAAHARIAEYGAESMRVNTDATLRSEGMALAASHHHHEYMFSSAVYDGAVEACLNQLAVWHRQDPECDMHIILDSPGGSVIDGMHLFDQLTAYSKRPWDDSNRPKGTHHTIVTVRGYAASMAGILLQAADVRRIGPESYIMIHELSSTAQGKIGELKDEIRFLDKISDRVAQLFIARSNDKISLSDFKTKWERQDWWLTSTEALDFGFVDEIG